MLTLAGEQSVYEILVVRHQRAVMASAVSVFAHGGRGGKYLLAVVGVLGTTLLSMLSEWAAGGFALSAESIAAALMYACIVLLLTATSLPPMFRFGVEKGRLFYFLFVGAFVALLVGFGERVSALLVDTDALPALLFAAAAALPVSAVLSAAGYGRRCFS